MSFSALQAKQELSRRAKEELQSRCTLPEFKASVIAQLKADLFKKQRTVLQDKSPLLSLCCSRRAGKSELAARMIAIALTESGHNDVVLFCAQTLQRARQIMWPILEKMNTDMGLGWTMSAHIGQVVTRDGAMLMLLGVTDNQSIEKVRGSRYRLAFVDESSTFEHLLERLVVDCLLPGTLDFTPRGKIVLAGTPGYSRVGYWWQVATGLKKGWSHHAWTLFDNPMIENIEEKLKQVREEEGLSEEDPKYKREFLGLWTADESVLVYVATEARNTVKVLPNAPANLSLEQWIRDEWLVTCALDVGFTDKCAVAAIGSPPGSTDVYVLETFSQAKLRADEQALKLKEFRDKYRAQRTVIDVGGQGKLVHGEFNQRYGKMAGGAAMPAKKMNKVEAIGLFNTDMRLGRIKALMPSAGDVYSEWCNLPWADDARTKVHPAYDNHASDACLYAWREHRAFLAKPLPVSKTAAEQEADELAEFKRQSARRK